MKFISQGFVNIIQNLKYKQMVKIQAIYFKYWDIL